MTGAFGWILAWQGIVSVWTILLLAQRRIRREGLVLGRRAPEAPGAALPSACAIVPVRNAPDAVERVATDLLAQDHPGLEIRIVDDRSTDGTGARLAALHAVHPHLVVDRIERLPAGWLGKSHALWTASGRTDAEWLVFVDDDCRLDPAAVRSAVMHAQTLDVDLLTLWPRHEGATMGERLLVPLCGGIVALWFGGRTRGGAPRAFANGQFLVVRRDAYRAFGGHLVVRDALIEDVALAEAAAAHGCRAWVGSGAPLYSVRMYDGLRSAMAGWSRIFAGILRSGVRVALSVLWLLLGSLLPYVALPAAAWLAWSRSAAGEPIGATTHAVLATAAMHLAMMTIVSVRFWALGGCPRRDLWLYPVSVVLVIATLLRAGWWLLVTHRVVWRSTSYRIDRRGRIVGPASPPAT